MTHRPEITRTAAARGFVDNASALPTTPPAPHQQESRTFDSSPKADIFTRRRHARAIVADLHVHGTNMLSRFSAPPGGTQWYYRRLADIFGRKLPGSMAVELQLAAQEILKLAPVGETIGM
jgi:hypothetical protein